MKVFISRANADRAVLENSLRLPLEHKKIPFWTDDDLKNGKRLTDGLLEAIDQCVACVFIATESGLSSQWCMMEVAAFFAARKRVFIFSPTGTLRREDLPAYLQDLVFQGTVGEVVKEVEKELEVVQQRTPSPRTVSELPVVELREMVLRAAGLAGQEQIERTANGVFLFVRGMFEMAARNAADVVVEEGERRHLGQYHPAVIIVLDRLTNLVGLPMADVVEPVALQFLSWQYALIGAGEDRWSVYGLDDSATPLLLIHTDNDGSVDGIALTARLSEGLLDPDYWLAGEPRVGAYQRVD